MLKVGQHKVDKTEATAANVHLHCPFPLAGKERNQLKRFRDWVRRKAASFQIRGRMLGSTGNVKGMYDRKTAQRCTLVIRFSFTSAQDLSLQGNERHCRRRGNTKLGSVTADAAIPTPTAISLDPTVTKTESSVIMQHEPVIVTIPAEVSKVVETTEEPCSLNSTINKTTVRSEISKEVLEIAPAVYSLNHPFTTGPEDVCRTLVWAADRPCCFNTAVAKNESPVVGHTESPIVSVAAEVSEAVVETSEEVYFLNAAVSKNESAVIIQTEPVIFDVGAEVSDEVVTASEELSFLNAAVTKNESSIIGEPEPVIKDFTVAAEVSDEVVSASEELTFLNGAVVSKDESPITGQTESVVVIVPGEVSEEIVETSEDVSCLSESPFIRQSELVIVTVPGEVSEEVVEIAQQTFSLNDAVPSPTDASWGPIAEAVQDLYLLNPSNTNNESPGIYQTEPAFVTVSADISEAVLETAENTRSLNRAATKNESSLIRQGDPVATTIPAEVSMEAVVVGKATCSRYACHPDGIYCSGVQSIAPHSLSDTDDSPIVDCIDVPQISMLEDSRETVSMFSRAADHDSFYALDVEECEINELSASAAAEIGEVGGTFTLCSNSLSSAKNKLRAMGPANTTMAGPPDEVCEEIVIFGISASNGHAFNSDCIHRFGRPCVLDHSVVFSDSSGTCDAENTSVIEDSWETVSTFSPAAERHDSFHELDLEGCETKELSASDRAEIAEVILGAEKTCSLYPTRSKNGLEDLGPSEPQTAGVRVEVCEEVVVTAQEQCFFTAAAAETLDEDLETEELCSFVTAATEFYHEEYETTEGMCTFLTAAAEVCDEAVVGNTTSYTGYGFNPKGHRSFSKQDMSDRSVSFSGCYDTSTFEAENSSVLEDSWETVSTFSRPAAEHESFHALDLNQRDLPATGVCKEIVRSEETCPLNWAITDMLSDQESRPGPEVSRRTSSATEPETILVDAYGIDIVLLGWKLTIEVDFPCKCK
ncbi:hypothetical protein V1509DRAFT_611150 [Lipomyces kononenkoae]